MMCYCSEWLQLVAASLRVSSLRCSNKRVMRGNAVHAGRPVCRGEELLELLQKPTAKENAAVEKFRTGGASVREYCPQLTKADCCRCANTPACFMSRVALAGAIR